MTDTFGGDVDDVPALVQAFNSMAVQQYSPGTNKPNLLHLSIRNHTVLKPPKHVVFLVWLHGRKGCALVAKKDLNELDEAKVKYIAHGLLMGFIRSPAAKSDGKPSRIVTSDAELGRRIGAALRRMGIVGDVAEIGTATLVGGIEADRIWDLFLARANHPFSPP